MAMPELRGRWCSSCGSLLSWDDQVCPCCGLPAEEVWDAPVGTPAGAGTPSEEEAGASPLDEETVLVSETADTRAIPRIESALPPERDPESRVEAQEVMPASRSLVLAALASVLLVCGIALYITRPWDPNAYSIKATEEADTSMAGFPGTVEALRGQDSDGSASVEVPSGDDAIFAQVEDAYAKLGTYAERADESEELFVAVAFGSDLTERTRGKREAEALAIDVSNLIDQLSEIDTSSATYVDDIDHLLTLGNWLRNRVDGLVAAWTADLESSDPAADEQRLRELLTADAGQNGINAYKALFDENYAAWQPVRRGG